MRKQHDIAPAPEFADELARAFRRGWCFFSSTPSLPPPAPLPQREDPSIAEAAKEKRLAAARRKGRRSTIVAGNLGDAEPNIDRPTLLGS